VQKKMKKKNPSLYMIIHEIKKFYRKEINKDYVNSTALPHATKNHYNVAYRPVAGQRPQNKEDNCHYYETAS
jgi:hypothetical protein